MDNVIYGGNYEGPSYQFTSSVTNLGRLPRFGHSSDFTAVFSPSQENQVDYAAGLISMFVFLLIIFIFWTIAIITFKVMGPRNAGFLSGYHFVVPDPIDDEKGIHKRPFRVRIVFLVATATLMIFAFLFVAKGLTNVSNAATTMGESLKTTEDIIANAELIAKNLEKVGKTSLEIRDAAVAELDNICPADPDIADTIGMDIMGIADQAKSDLTMLANFIQEGLEALNGNLREARKFTASAAGTMKSIEFWDWEMKLLSAGLFILPSFLAVGVGLIMLDLDVQPYQKALQYIFMPLFALTIIACYVVCCAILPISATSADACSGGGNVRAGPDDTVLTVYRNLMGDDDGLIFQFVGFYTQQCNPEYYPFDFLSTYLNDLDDAIDSTNDAVSAFEDYQDLLELQCGRKFDNVLEIVEDMNDNLRLLQKQADLSLDLVKCKNINSLYVNTVHEAGCTYSVDAMAWIFASSLVVSVCGMIMIMLRSAYYPEEYLELDKSWVSNPIAGGSKSRSNDSDGNNTAPTMRPSPLRSLPEEMPAAASERAQPIRLSPEAVPARAPATSNRIAPTSIQVAQSVDNDDEFEMGLPEREF